MGQSGWSTSEHIGMLVFRKLVSCSPFGTPVDQHHHQMTHMRKIQKIDFEVLSGPRVGFASVNNRIPISSEFHLQLSENCYRRVVRKLLYNILSIYIAPRVLCLIYTAPLH